MRGVGLESALFCAREVEVINAFVPLHDPSNKETVHDASKARTPAGDGSPWIEVRWCTGKGVCRSS